MINPSISLFQQNRYEIENEILNCTKCPLHMMLPNGCHPIIPNGTGDTMIIGEAPGKNEIELGMPFIGICGNMLDTMLKNAGLNRKNMVVTNTVKCRPTDTGSKNRPPKTSEIKECSTYLWQEINELRPKLIFTLGKVPTYELLRTVGLKKTFKMEDVVGKKYTILSHGSKESYYATVVPNYHPSFLMQYGKEKTILAIEIFRKHKEYLGT